MNRVFLAAVLTAASLRSAPGATTRLKELATLEGVRENQLIGYGVVVGLAGTGDKRQTVFSAQSLTNMLERMGVSVTPSAILIRNMAAVMVTANLPAFAQPGSRIDITASAIGDAANLQGGMLLLAPLRGADGQVYVVAQGSVVTGGFAAGRGTGNGTVVNHPTVGRIPGGGIVERAAPTVAPSKQVRLQLKHSDFTTAVRIAKAVNTRFTSGPAHAEHGGLVVVETPPEFKGKTAEFVAELEGLGVESDFVPRVLVNERTGTITMGKDIRIKPVAILHGNLAVEIQTTFAVSQPAPFGQGETAVVPKVDVAVKEDKAHSVILKEGATVEELVRALTLIGSTPRDVVAILQSLRASGALEAELEVI
jgi:flagellar P-ring protein precursor FlgI